MTNKVCLQTHYSVVWFLTVELVENEGGRVGGGLEEEKKIKERRDSNPRNISLAHQRKMKKILVQTAFHN